MRTKTTNDIDILLPRIIFLLCVLALVLLGLVMVYSASTMETINDEVSSIYFLRKQLIACAAGVVLAVVIWKFVPTRVINTPKFVFAFWGICIIGIFLTRFFGTEVLGARRWIVVFGFSLQISEFAKIAFVVMGAFILDRFRAEEFNLKQAAIWCFLTIIIPIGLLYVFQSDFGTTFIIAIGLLGVLWIGEVPWKIIFTIIGLLVVLGLIAVFGTAYRSDRFTYLDPWNDGEGGYGTGYQIIHSYYAFAEGGIFGVGLGNSHEKYLYLPEAETDFIFAVIGEELGLIGALLVVVLFLGILYAGMRICRGAKTGFDAMLSGSLTIMIITQAFLNIGCVIGLLPTTGKPLPFVSSGGSSLIATLMMVGIILAVSKASAGDDIHQKRRNDLRVVRAQ